MRKFNFVNRFGIQMTVCIVIAFVLDDLFYSDAPQAFVCVATICTVFQLLTEVVAFIKKFKISKKEEG